MSNSKCCTILYLWKWHNMPEDSKIIFNNTVRTSNLNKCCLTDALMLEKLIDIKYAHMKPLFGTYKWYIEFSKHNEQSVSYKRWKFLWKHQQLQGSHSVLKSRSFWDMTSCQVVLEASYHRRLERVTCCIFLTTTSNSRISIEQTGSNTCKLWT
jgi:hypothetical protein